ncbi:hypothetical protein ACS0TY_006057 [Phlomoides rotata]
MKGNAGIYPSVIQPILTISSLHHKENSIALRATSGNVHATVERLLGNPDWFQCTPRLWKNELVFTLDFLFRF